MTVGERIRIRRVELGLTQEELATKLGLKGKASISKCENAGDGISTKSITKYAEALDCSASWLMGWSDSNPCIVDDDAHTIALVYEKLDSDRKNRLMAYATRLMMEYNK